MEKILNNLKNGFLDRENMFFVFLLSILCVIFFFTSLGGYRLIDIDETRYINIARNMFDSKDYITPYLNFEPFLEKPPLFYWLVVFSYEIFHNINEFTSRFPTALIASIGVFGTYFFVSHIIKSKLPAFLSAVILMSSFWYALFAHIAILDSSFCVFTMLALYFGVSTLKCENEISKKILWYFGYFFLALSVLQKGLIGVIIPGGSLLLIFLVLKRAKEIIKPSYILPGILIFFLITAPWHILVYKANGITWFNDYIVKHHFARFIDSTSGIGRKQPFLFYIPVILGGLLPWSLFFISALVKGVKYIFCTVKSAKSIKPLFSKDTNDRMLILISICYFLFVFLFFSISSTKLPTYILTAFPPISILTGYFIWGHIKEEKNKKYIEISAFTTFLIFFAAGVFGIYYYFSKMPEIGLMVSIAFIILPIFGIICLLKNKRILLFICLLGLSYAVFGMEPNNLMNYVTSFGQEELEEYAKIANEDEKAQGLMTLGFSNKYSMSNIYRKKPIRFIPDGDNKYVEFKEAINKYGRSNVYLITKNKKEYEWDFLIPFESVKKGKKYSLYKLLPIKCKSCF